MQKAILKSLFLINAAFVLCGQRISEPIDGSHSVVLEGLLPPQANLAIDQGTIDPLHPIRHVSILFKKTAAQQADF